MTGTISLGIYLETIFARMVMVGTEGTMARNNVAARYVWLFPEKEGASPD